MNVMYFSADWCGPCKVFKPIVHYQTLWFQYVKLDETRQPYADISGSVIVTPGDVPYENPTYSNINWE